MVNRLKMACFDPQRGGFAIRAAASPAELARIQEPRRAIYGESSMGRDLEEGR
jgi:hypothetical protein